MHHIGTHALRLVVNSVRHQTLNWIAGLRTSTTLEIVLIGFVWAIIIAYCLMHIYLVYNRIRNGEYDDI